MASRASRIVMTERHIRLATEGLEPREVAKQMAALARSELSNAITSGEASPIYDRWVNGTKDKSEDDVTPPGPIVYVFSYWQPIVEFALKTLARRSPVKTGRYQGSHRVMLGSQFIAADTQISRDEEVTIVDTQPYSRKIEVGHMKMSVPDGVYQDVRKDVQRQFRGMVDVQFKMIYLPGGYVLKGRFTKGHKPRARKALQKDTAAGQRVTYPALILRMKR